MDQKNIQEQSTTPVDTKQVPQFHQPQQMYYPQIPNGYPMYNPYMYAPQQQQEQVPSENVQYPTGSIPMNANFAYPMNYIPQYHTAVPPTPPTRRCCRWNICGGKKMPLKKKFNVHLILQLLLLSIANLFYGLSLTFFLLTGGITCTIAYLANRKKSEMLHGVFFGLSFIELFLFSFALLAAFPLWAGGVSSHHEVERYNSQNNHHHEKYVGHLQRAAASFHSFGPTFGHFAHNHYKQTHNKNEEKTHERKRHHRHHHLSFNPFVWVGYVFFISYGVLRIKNMVFSVRLIKTYRKELEEKLREQFQSEQEQNTSEENVELN